MLRPESIEGVGGLVVHQDVLPAMPELVEDALQVLGLRGLHREAESTTLRAPSLTRWVSAERRAAARAFFGMA